MKTNAFSTVIDTLVGAYDDYTRKGRVHDLRQLATEYNFDFKKRASFDDQNYELKGFKAFSKKGKRRLSGILTFQPEQFKGQIRFYDFLKTVDLETSSHSVVEVFCEDIHTNYTLIEPLGTFAKMKGFFVSDEQQFPELKEFNQLFQISSKAEEDTDWLSRSALASMVDFKGIRMEARGNYFLFYYKKKEIKAHKIIPTLAFAEDFIQLSTNDISGEFV